MDQLTLSVEAVAAMALRSAMTQSSANVAFSTGASYAGDTKFGLRHGTGTLQLPDGAVYEGAFEGNAAEGSGVLRFADGAEYRGEVSRGRRHGHGVFVKRGSGGSFVQYTGGWREGMRHGDGTLLYDEAGAAQYVGGWVDDQRHGRGSMRYASGSTYDGDWRADRCVCVGVWVGVRVAQGGSLPALVLCAPGLTACFPPMRLCLLPLAVPAACRKEGIGRMVWRSRGEEYVGEWAADVPHGVGVLSWFAPGTPQAGLDPASPPLLVGQYCGEFSAGLRHGMGTFTYMNGAR
jgi:hypothetical protein